MSAARKPKVVENDWPLEPCDARIDDEACTLPLLHDGPHQVATIDPEPAIVPAVAMIRRGLGHEMVELLLPASVVDTYATRRAVPELRGIVAMQVLAWAERVS